MWRLGNIVLQTQIGGAIVKSASTLGRHLPAPPTPDYGEEHILMVHVKLQAETADFWSSDVAEKQHACDAIERSFKRRGHPLAAAC
jgi:hypothetical protein